MSVVSTSKNHVEIAANASVEKGEMMQYGENNSSEVVITQQIKSQAESLLKTPEITTMSAQIEPKKNESSTQSSSKQLFSVKDTLLQLETLSKTQGQSKSAVHSIGTDPVSCTLMLLIILLQQLQVQLFKTILHEKED